MSIVDSVLSTIGLARSAPLPTAPNVVNVEIPGANINWLANTDEAKRKRVRRELRNAQAQLQINRRRIAEIDSDAARHQESLDLAAAEHVDFLAPLQAELAEIEGRQVEAIANRQPTDAIADARRRELLAILGDRNATLELLAERTKKLIEPLQNERELLRRAVANAAVIDSMLLRTARPDLADKLATAQSGLEWASRRLRDATNNVAKFSDLIARATKTKRQPAPSEWLESAPHQDEMSGTELAICRRHLQRWNVEAAAAQAAVAAAEADCKACEKESIEE